MKRLKYLTEISTSNVGGEAGKERRTPIKNTDSVEHWWLIPVILVTQEAEIRRTAV
jgi:hypothetical protein